MGLRKNHLTATYRNKRVLVTGHTGFKGSWLSLWLELLGAEVYGVALPAGAGPQHSKLLALKHRSEHLDIRDIAAFEKICTDFRPEIVFHLAAQSLVGTSYLEPLTTFDVNIRGTLNVLECARKIGSAGAIVCVTSDKVYASTTVAKALTEDFRLEGSSPYAASKSACELVIASYRQSYFNASHSPMLGVARAGNIIGGGDWGEQRLVPDLIRASYEGKHFLLRNPEFQRTWLHVFDAIHGYLVLGAELAARNPLAADAFNFGPISHGSRPVTAVLDLAKQRLPPFATDLVPRAVYPEEATITLDATKAREVLGWKNYLDFEQTIEDTLEWYRAFYQTGQITSRAALTHFIENIS